MAVNSDPIMTWSFIRKCEPSDAILDVLVPGERVLQCYATVRDKAALTDKRIIFTDVQGITGKKKRSIPSPIAPSTCGHRRIPGILIWMPNWTCGQRQVISR